MASHLDTEKLLPSLWRNTGSVAQSGRAPGMCNISYSAASAMMVALLRMTHGTNTLLALRRHSQNTSYWTDLWNREQVHHRPLRARFYLIHAARHPFRWRHLPKKWSP